MNVPTADAQLELAWQPAVARPHRPAEPTASTVTRGPVPDLRDYDQILVNSSAGKDSQATLDVVVAAARATDVVSRVVVVHADLGDAEWDGVPELAAEHAAHYGLRFEITSNPETILDRTARRGAWPSAKVRWCTSDHKRGPIRKVMTRWFSARESQRVVGRPVRLLNVMGLRARKARPAAGGTPTP